MLAYQAAPFHARFTVAGVKQGVNPALAVLDNIR
jgi:hypothetical protein